MKTVSKIFSTICKTHNVTEDPTQRTSYATSPAEGTVGLAVVVVVVADPDDVSIISDPELEEVPVLDPKSDKDPLVPAAPVPDPKSYKEPSALSPEPAEKPVDDDSLFPEPEEVPDDKPEEKVDDDDPISPKEPEEGPESDP